MISSDIEKTDVLIMGAGYAGLAVAAQLSRKGVRGEVFETQPFPGGRARSETRDGFILDYGIHGHRCADDSSAARLLRSLGDAIEWAPEFGAKPLTYAEGEKFIFPKSISEAIKLPFLPPGDRLRLLALMGRMKYGKPARHVHKSLASYVGPWASRTKLRILLRSFGLAIMCPDIEVASASEVLEMVQAGLKAEQALGAPRGGEGQVIAKLVKQIHDPIRMNLNCKVKKIQITKGRVEAVETAQGIFKPKLLVFTLPLQKLFGFIERKHFSAEMQNYAGSVAPTAGISVDLALREPVTDIAGAILDLDGPFMGKYPSIADPSLAPPGKQLATWLWVLEPGKLREKPFLKSVREKLRKKIDQLAPNTIAATMWERWLYFPILDGVQLRVGQAWQDRSPLQSKDIGNLFFAGDTTRAPGVGGEIAFESALRVVPLIERFLEENK